jgi:FkbM family methyltransferase
MAIKRTRKTIRVAAIILAVAALLAVTAGRSSSVKGFFWLERQWDEHWHHQTGKQVFVNLEPFLRKVGFLRPVRIEVEPGISFLLDSRDLVPSTILKTGEWQPEVWNSIVLKLSEGAVFFDVGAHIGYFSMKAARRVGKSGQVVAFERNPEILKLLRDNVAANHADNVTVEPIACTDREQMLTLYAAPSINTGASSLARENSDVSEQESARPFAVRGRPIDDVVRELRLTRVDAMKIDVEGAELSVLRGALDTLKRFHPKLVLEVIPRQLASFHTTPDDVVSLLRGAGYNLGRPLNPEEADWEWSAQPLASTILISDTSASGQLIRGFYSLERKSWRWTGGKFTVALRPPDGADSSGAVLVLKFAFPEVSFSKLREVTISAVVGSTKAPPASFNTPGSHTYRAYVPASALGNSTIEVDFSLDKFLPASEYGRDLGIIVTSVGFEPK